jgi:alkylation response protein AidB-like acyl-CoA dehydrogenase
MSMTGSNIRPEIATLVAQIGAMEVAKLGIEERIAQLLALKVHALPIVHKDLRAEEFLAVVAELGSIDAPAALSLSMHLYTLWGLVNHQADKFGDIFDQIARNGKLMGSLNEPGLYFMVPGQLDIETYPVRARKVAGGYRVNGVKKFVSLEPFVSYLPVYCMVEDYAGDDLGVICLMLRKDSDGVSVLRDWNSVAMQDTHSNSIKFADAFCPDQDAICNEDTSIASLAVQGILFRFNVNSVYLGISRRALALAITTATSKRPPNGKHTLAKYPGIQFSVAEMEISMEIMEAQMRSFSAVLNRYLAGDEQAQRDIGRVSLIAKEVIARESDALVSNAMKITGINSLSNDNILASLFKDVKAAQFHPPQRDVTFELLAKESLGVISYKQRWL